jgi:hypothetical protein
MLFYSYFKTLVGKEVRAPSAPAKTTASRSGRLRLRGASSRNLPRGWGRPAAPPAALQRVQLAAGAGVLAQATLPLAAITSFPDAYGADHGRA